MTDESVFGVIAELRRFGTATVFAADEAVRVLPPRLRRFSGTSCAGPVHTVLMAAEDNLALHEAIAAATPGAVIVGAVERGVRGGYFGEIMARACMLRRIGGVILDTTIRDVDELARLAFPVFATGTCLRDTRKNRFRHSSEIELGETLVRHGDWIVADGTALVIFPEAMLADVLRRCRKRYERESAMRREVDRGVSTLHLVREDGG